MQICDHISDGHLCFDSAFMCPKLIITLNTQIFSFKSSTPLLGIICINLLLFLEVHSWLLLAVFCCPQKYLSNPCIYWNLTKYGTYLLILYSWLMQRQSVEIKRKFVEFCFPDEISRLSQASLPLLLYRIKRKYFSFHMD